MSSYTLFLRFTIFKVLLLNEASLVPFNSKFVFKILLRVSMARKITCTLHCTHTLSNYTFHTLVLEMWKLFIIHEKFTLSVQIAESFLFVVKVHYSGEYGCYSCSKKRIR